MILFPSNEPPGTVSGDLILRFAGHRRSSGTHDVSLDTGVSILDSGEGIATLEVTAQTSTGGVAAATATATAGGAGIGFTVVLS